jgi:RNA polymerase sigma-70 factor (sigma-E family)
MRAFDADHVQLTSSATGQQVHPRQVAGPPADVTTLYITQRLPLVRLASLLVMDRHTAEDVVQDAFAALHQRWRSLDDPHAALAYLRRSVLNNCRSVLRRRRTRNNYVPPIPVPEPGADQAVLRADEQRRVVAALRRLPLRKREALVLRYWAGLSDAEIAATLGIKATTVRSTISRGLDQLEQDLGW